MDDDAFFNDLLAAVDQQLASPNTPYVAKALARLTSRGVDEAEAKEMIAEILAEETDAMYRRRGNFDERSYKERLQAL